MKTHATSRTPPVTVRVTARQSVSSRMAGQYGSAYYEYLDTDGKPSNCCYGMPLSDVLADGAMLPDGTELEVTVRVIKRGRYKKNPWLKRG